MRCWTSSAEIKMPPGSDWAAVSVELLSEVFTLVSLKTKIFCEGVCKTWRSTLRDEGLWGNLVCYPTCNSEMPVLHAALHQKHSNHCHTSDHTFHARTHRIQGVCP